MERVRQTINVFIGLIILVVAIGGTITLILTKPHAPQGQRRERIPAVSVATVEPRIFAEPIIGHGTIQAKHQLSVIPLVGGRIIEMHDDLAQGNYIRKDEVLFRIDPSAYETKVAQTRAEIKRLNARKLQLEQKQESMEKQLASANERLELARKNWQREKTLLKDDHTTEVQEEAAANAFSLQEEAVLAIESELKSIPHTILETEALIDLQNETLKEAQRMLKETTITCPFDARVDHVSANELQVVSQGVPIAVLTDMEALEISASVEPWELRWMNINAFARAVGKDRGDSPDAVVSWTVYDKKYLWEGPVTRLEQVDPATRTARIVVEIRDVLDKFQFGAGESLPPLSVGMFCSVAIPAEPLEDALVIPRSAIHGVLDDPSQNFVYVYVPDSGDAETGTLQFRNVPILRTIGEQVLVSFTAPDKETIQNTQALATQAVGPCELQPGELVITSPLPDAAAMKGAKIRLRK